MPHSINTALFGHNSVSMSYTLLTPRFVAASWYECVKAPLQPWRYVKPNWCLTLSQQLNYNATTPLSITATLFGHVNSSLRHAIFTAYLDTITQFDQINKFIHPIDPFNRIDASVCFRSYVFLCWWLTPSSQLHLATLLLQTVNSPILSQKGA